MAEKRASSPKQRPAPRRRVRARKTSARTLTVLQVRSGIGCTERQRGVLRALGLKGPNHRRSLPDLPSVRGMVQAVPHLVRIEEPAGAAVSRRKA